MREYVPHSESFDVDEIPPSPESNIEGKTSSSLLCDMCSNPLLPSLFNVRNLSFYRSPLIYYPLNLAVSSIEHAVVLADISSCEGGLVGASVASAPSLENNCISILATSGPSQFPLRDIGSVSENGFFTVGERGMQANAESHRSVVMLGPDDLSNAIDMAMYS